MKLKYKFLIKMLGTGFIMFGSSIIISYYLEKIHAVWFIRFFIGITLALIWFFCVLLYLSSWQNPKEKTK